MMSPLQVLGIGALAILGVEATCYLPNGTEISAGYAPCGVANGAHSMCCRLKDTVYPHRCRSDGLCIPNTNNKLWRGTCTDPTWENPACLHLCTDGDGKNSEPFKCKPWYLEN